MRLSSRNIMAVIIVAGLLFAVLAGSALAAPPWSDAPNSWWVGTYDVTESEVGTVADGYPGGLFKPTLAVTRGQFAKMSVDGLDLATLDPATPTFKDVAKGTTFYTYIEGACAEGVINGYPVTGGLEFRPSDNITRQQTNSILARYLSEAELDAGGVIHGDVSTYASLNLWYAAEGAFYLNGYYDAGQIAADHRATTAYLVYHDVVKGADGYLKPLTTLNRAQAAVMILRVAEEAADITTVPVAPTDLEVAPTSPDKDTTPIVTGKTIPGGIVHIYDSLDGAAVVDLFAGVADGVAPRADAGGTFIIQLPVLDDGTHVFTAKVKNSAGLVSAYSEDSATYVLDTVEPEGDITAPVVATGEDDAAVNSSKPAFTVTAEDDLSGVYSVKFEVAVDETTPEYDTISTDYIAATGGVYEAVWPSSGDLSAGLEDGQYVLRATVYDEAGNSEVIDPVKVTVDTEAPTVEITSPLPNEGGIFYTEDATPEFRADAADDDPDDGDAGGVAKVEFFYVDVTNDPTAQPDTFSDFTLLSADISPAYGAHYDAGLDNGCYILAVRAIDRAGNVSVLMDPEGDDQYKDGVTQKIIIDDEAPVITIVEPGVGDLVPDDTEFEVKWSIEDLTMTTADKVTIEYTTDGSVADPDWDYIVASTANDGSYVWEDVPDIAGDDSTKFEIRITAVDEAGAIVGDVSGHTSVKTSGLFTVFNEPDVVIGLTGSDPDTANAGVDGRDFTATWTLSTTPLAYVASQKVYILPAATALVLSGTGAHTAVATLADTATTWTGAGTLVADSDGDPLAAGSYKVWLVVTDLAGRTAAAGSSAFTVTAE